MIVITPKEPNNLRNCWRRMRDAHIAYGWGRTTFREWLNSRSHPSYTAEPRHRNFDITLRNAQH